jgi:hypothetical protein
MELINKAGKLRWGNGGNRTHAVQVKQPDPAFALPTSLSALSYSPARPWRQLAGVTAVLASKPTLLLDHSNN